MALQLSVDTSLVTTQFRRGHTKLYMATGILTMGEGEFLNCNLNMSSPGVQPESFGSIHNVIENSSQTKVVNEVYGGQHGAANFDLASNSLRFKLDPLAEGDDGSIAGWTAQGDSANRWKGNNTSFATGEIVYQYSAAAGGLDSGSLAIRVGGNILLTASVKETGHSRIVIPFTITTI